MDHKVMQPNPKFLYEENGAKVFFFHCICLSKDPKIPKRTQSPKNLCRHRVVLYLCLEHPSPKQLVESKVWSLVTGKNHTLLVYVGRILQLITHNFYTFFYNFKLIESLARFSQFSCEVALNGWLNVAAAFEFNERSNESSQRGTKRFPQTAENII